MGSAGYGKHSDRIRVLTIVVYMHYINIHEMIKFSLVDNQE